MLNINNDMEDVKGVWLKYKQETKEANKVLNKRFKDLGIEEELEVKPEEHEEEATENDLEPVNENTAIMLRIVESTKNRLNKLKGRKCYNDLLNDILDQLTKEQEKNIIELQGFKKKRKKKRM
jgi:hypothetical protein